MTDQDRPQTGEEALRWAASFLKDRGWTNQAARQEARLLLAKAWQKDALHLTIELKEQPDEAVWASFHSFVQQRGENVPLHYLLGEKEFMSLSFKVSPAVLIPRWETELLVEEAIRLGKAWAQAEPSSEGLPPLRILELGTGSGAIAVSLAYYLPAALLVATDISKEALQVARENAARHGVLERISFRQGDLFAPLAAGERFELIISNPPYLDAREMQQLPPDVRKEPALALAGGEDGLAFYRRIAGQARQHLAPNGRLLMEIGWQQGEAVKGILTGQGYAPVKILRDLEQRDRVVVY